MPRFSLRTLIVVMLLGGPMVAWAYKAPVDVFCVLIGLGAVTPIVWLGWWENTWHNQPPDVLNIGAQVLIYSALFVGFLVTLANLVLPFLVGS